MNLRTAFQLASLLVVFLLSASSAEEWPAWRGPRGDGTSLEQEVPTHWNATENIAWQVEIPGVGHASPIVFGDYLFLVTCIEETKDRVLLCLERKTGRTLWRSVVIRTPLEAIHQLNSRASSTPATDGEYVYVSFLEPDGSTVPAEVVRIRSGDLRADNTGKPVNPGSMCVAAYDMNGQRRWIARPGEFASVWGYCASPIVFEDTVIINGDHDGDAYIVALDRRTGETVWKVARENRIRSHCVPLIRKLDGRMQMMVAGSHSIVSYNPRSDSKHWYTVGPQGRAVASPVFAAGLLLVSTAHPDREFLAIRPDGHDDVTETHIAWRNGQSASYVPSPIAVAGYFLAVSDDGIASCFDAATGKRHWRQRIGKRHSAALVTAGGLVYFLSDAGVTRVVRPGAQFELIAENSVGHRCYASPAISNGQIFLRSEKHLSCIGKRRN
ncbi:MAG: serine/threonine protein kinase [Planctomycetaceae bacterium]|nr:serine/threonine protein kinase [Planctomycetaceae bacterium]